MTDTGKFLKTETIEKAYLGKRALDLVNLITEQVEKVYRGRGIVIPASPSSTLHYIWENDGVSLADIARALNATHQITTQRVHKLEKLGLVEKRADANDLRRFEWHLTVQGRDQAARLENCMVDAADIYQELYDEINIDLADALDKAHDALLKTPLTERFANLDQIQETG